MAAVTKFMFDTKFENITQTAEETKPVPEEEKSSAETSEEETDVEEEEELPGYSETQMEAAKAESFEAGRQEGMRESASTIEKDLLMTIQAISLNITELFGRQEQANSALLRDGIGIASTIVRKLFPAMNEQNSLGEIDRLVEHTLLRLIEEPRVVIRVNPDLMEALGERVDGLKAGAGYEGRIIIKEDGSLPYGDCRMEWGDGSAERNVEALWQSIDQIIAGNLGTSQMKDDGHGAETGAVEVSDVLTPDLPAENDRETAQNEENEQENTESSIETDSEQDASAELPETSEIEPPQDDGQEVPAGSEEEVAESETVIDDENTQSVEDENISDTENSTDSAPSGTDSGESMNSGQEDGIVEAISETEDFPEQNEPDTEVDGPDEAETISENAPETDLEDHQSDDKADG